MSLFQQDLKIWRHQFEVMLTDIRDKKKEDEKKSEDNSKTNERSTSSLSAGLRKI